MAFDFDGVLNAALVDPDLFGSSVIYRPLVSDPGAAPFELCGIFDRNHTVVLDEIARSELKAPGHSTTMPVLTVRFMSFSFPPKAGDRIEIGRESFAVYDIQPDGQGAADLILREWV